MKVCYLIQSHGAPGQVERLVRTLKRGSPGAEVLVVHDARRAPLSPEPRWEWHDVEVINRRERVERGEFSVLSPLLAGLEELFGSRGGRLRWGFDWLVYLSGQDYPVRPLAEFEESLASADHQGFLTFWDVERPENPWKPRQARTRYYAQYRRLPDWTLGPLRAARFLGKATPLRFHLHYGPFVGWEPRRTPFEGATRLYGGWQWWTLARPAAEHLWRAVAADDPLVRWFRKTIAPCEALVPTVLVNSGRFDLEPDSRRFVDFAGSRDGRPRTLNENDLPRMAAGRFDFARKFEMAQDPGLLDRIDAELLGLG
ncbi:MAG: beta-1,6-N-acetylglucosaminyltransferase [Acidobacteriota bacterium]